MEKFIAELPVSPENWPDTYDTTDKIQFKYVFFFDNMGRARVELMYRVKVFDNMEWEDCEWEKDSNDDSLGILTEYIPKFIEILERMYKLRNLI